MNVKKYNQSIYHFHEIARVLANPSRRYGRVQWVFSPPVHSLRTRGTLVVRVYKGCSILHDPLRAPKLGAPCPVM